MQASAPAKRSGRLSLPPLLTSYMRTTPLNPFMRSAPLRRDDPAGCGEPQPGRAGEGAPAQPEDASEPLVRKGFKEWELARRTQTYGCIGHIGHIESTDAGEAHEDGRRWWIRSVMGMSESPEHPIPRRYVEKQ